MNKDTVSMHFVRAAVQRLTDAARARVLCDAGIAPSLLAAPDARVPAPSFSSLWLAVSREIDDEFFGLDRRGMKVGSFALVCHAAVACASLDRALKTALRGFNVLLHDLRAQLSLDGPQAVVRLDNRIVDLDRRRFADETFLVMVHGLMCWLAGRRVPLSSVAFAWPQPAHAHEYTVMFSENLTFDAPVTSIRFDARALTSAVVQTDATLTSFLRDAPQSVFLKYRNLGSFASRLRRHLRRFVGHADWPRLDEVARAMNVSPSTMRRRLEAEFTSYQGLKDQVRRDAAIHLLCATDLTIADIAAQLGFDEPSAFRRAFKTWCGVRPRAYLSRHPAP